MPITSVTPVGFIDVATTFQGAETIKCGYGVYKVGWSLQSRRHAAGPEGTAMTCPLPGVRDGLAWLGAGIDRSRLWL